MNTFGYKIVDKSLSDITRIVESALDMSRPLEVGFYFGDKDANAYLNEMLPGACIPLNTHLDHREYNVFSLDHRLDKLRKELDRIVQLGSDYSITHIGAHLMTQRQAHWPALMEFLGQQLETLQQLCEEYNHAVYIENTYHSINFYRSFFELVSERCLDRIHQCFDIGHAKVWSNDPLSDWLAFLEERSQQGGKLHFHLHANRGLWDDHLSFVEAMQLGIVGADSYLGKWDYFMALDQIRERFPACRKVFEVKPEQALANMELVMERLSHGNDSPLRQFS